jgi:hypothetical protein
MNDQVPLTLHVVLVHIHPAWRRPRQRSDERKEVVAWPSLSTVLAAQCRTSTTLIRMPGLLATG